MFLSVDDPGASKVEGVADAGDLDHPGGASPKNGSVHRAPFGVSPAGISRGGRRCTGWMFRGTRVSISQPVNALSMLTLTMPKFVIERDVPGVGELTDAEIREISMKSVAAIRSMGHDIQWLHSYVTGDKVYCVYLAADESVVREHAKRAGLPANRVSAVRRLLDATSGE
jgi:uncharacterized protein DUF4242